MTPDQGKTISFNHVKCTKQKLYQILCEKYEFLFKNSKFNCACVSKNSIKNCIIYCLIQWKKLELNLRSCGSNINCYLLTWINRKILYKNNFTTIITAYSFSISKEVIFLQYFFQYVIRLMKRCCKPLASFWVGTLTKNFFWA